MKLKSISLFLLTIFAGAIAFSQDVPVTASDELLKSILDIFSLKGATTLAIVAAIVQLGMKFVGSPLFSVVLKDIDAKKKHAIYTVLVALSGVIVMPASGMTWFQTVIGSGSLFVFMKTVYDLTQTKQ